MIEKTADWTLHPIAERDLADERRRQLGKRRIGWALTLSTIGVPVLALLDGIIRIPNSNGIEFVLLFTAILLAIEHFRRTMRNEDFDNRRDQALHAEYRSLPGSWLVELTIYQGGTATGKDRGMVWFEDGALFFVGHRTSFGIAPETVRDVRLKNENVADLRSTLTLTLDKRTSAGNLAIGFDPTRSELFGRKSAEVMRGLDVLIQDWLRGETREATQWPPTTIGPGMPSPNRLLFRAVANTVFWVAALTGAGLLIDLQGYPALFTLFCAGLTLPFCPELLYPLRRWLSWRARQKLDRWNP